MPIEGKGHCELLQHRFRGPAHFVHQGNPGMAQMHLPLPAKRGRKPWVREADFHNKVLFPSFQPMHIQTSGDPGAVTRVSGAAGHLRGRRGVPPPIAPIVA